MSTQTFPVTPGAVMPLTASLAAGSVIINTDAAAAVWIGDNPNTAPGQGVRLGPRGSMTWTTAGAGAYAVLDAGATTPVAVTVSTDISAVDNPVDIGVAVATQLLAQGVPSVLVGANLVNTGTPGGPYVADVSGYASIALSIYCQGTGLLSINFQSGSNPLLYEKNYTIAADGEILFITLPVAGPTLYINTVGALALNVQSGYGSNRLLPAAVTNHSTVFASAPNQPWPLQPVALPGALITGGGAHNVLVETTASGAGQLVATAWDDNANAMGGVLIYDTSQAHASPISSTILAYYGTIILPAGIIGFTWQSKTAATYQVVLKIIPTT